MFTKKRIVILVFLFVSALASFIFWSYRMRQPYGPNWIPPRHDLPPAPPVPDPFEALSPEHQGPSQLVPPRKDLPPAPPLPGAAIPKGTGKSQLVPPRKDLPPAPPLPFPPPGH